MVLRTVWAQTNNHHKAEKIAQRKWQTPKDLNLGDLAYLSNVREYSESYPINTWLGQNIITALCHKFNKSEEELNNKHFLRSNDVRYEVNRIRLEFRKKSRK